MCASDVRLLSSATPGDKITTTGDLNADCSSIALGGDDNKSGRVRSVYVPTYVREAIIERRIQTLLPNINLFTGNETVYNESYFNTAWSRLKERMFAEGLVGKDHTLYSFRHTAAINLHMKTKDLYKVQQAMGHSSMVITLMYMRSLGLINNISVEDAPEL